MPLLDDDEVRRMKQDTWTCRDCGGTIRKNYCRQCDEFFYEGHTKECDSAFERDFGYAEHAGHRTY